MRKSSAVDPGSKTTEATTFLMTFHKVPRMCGRQTGFLVKSFCGLFSSAFAFGRVNQDCEVYLFLFVWGCFFVRLVSGGF